MRKAVSTYISSALLILIIITAISVTLTIFKPTLDKAKDTAIINEAFQNLEMLDKVVKEVVSEGEGSRRTISLTVSDGVYSIDPQMNSINFTYKLKSNLKIGGSRSGINITSTEGRIILFIRYPKIDLQGSAHFPKGINKVLIFHNGTNSTNFPIIYIGK